LAKLARERLFDEDAIRAPANLARNKYDFAAGSDAV
jgi:hypothetical protein